MKNDEDIYCRLIDDGDEGDDEPGDKEMREGLEIENTKLKKINN